ncbi:hypothetical protein T484DRAFT_2928794 [Baffinella frigidus]|nr:hypothetical protein T484DRAFT_2928794 [Cryptophyta sp. CCMP2293]
MSVTVEQVREHLEQLGYFDVPDEVLQDFRRELSTRIVGTAHSALEEEEQESAGVEIHPARGYGVEEGDEGAKRGLGGTPVRVRAASRLGGKAMRVDPRVAIKLDQYEADESENEKENMQNKAERPATSDRPRSATARRPITAPGYAPPPARQERQETHAPSRMSANTSLSTSSRASFSSPAVIKPSAHPHGRATKRTDPVAAYHKTRESWAAAPSVTGSRKQVIDKVASTRAPVEHKIWKAVHPMQNSLGTSDYKGPSGKSRAAERNAVRDSLKWTEVYHPPKVDRVKANHVRPHPRNPKPETRNPKS